MATLFLGAKTTDANRIPTFNEVGLGFTSTATAAATTTLTATSTQLQYFTGTTTQTVALPVATTLNNGSYFQIFNLSTGSVTVQTSGANTLVTIAAGFSAIVMCSNSAGGTGTASWTYLYQSINTTTTGGGGGVTSVAALTLGTTGTDLSSTVANGSTTPVITLNVPDASNTARGVITTGTQTISGLKSFQGTTASDIATLGSELLSTASGTNWTGTSLLTGGYTHTPGSTVALVSSTSLTISTQYYLSVTVTGLTAGYVTVTGGGFSSFILLVSTNSTQTVSLIATATTPITITPLTTFDGTVTASLKAITASSAGHSLLNSAGTAKIEFRPDTNSNNTFIGLLSGSKNYNGTANTTLGTGAFQNGATGSNNIAIGYNALNLASNVSNTIAIGYRALANISVATTNNSIDSVAIGYNALSTVTTGVQNIAIGYSAGSTHNSSYNTIIGINAGTGALGGTNVAIGTSALSGGTGSSNVVIGFTALTTGASSNNIAIGYGSLNPTVGNDNVAIGYNSGKFISGGVTNNSVSSNSIFIGTATYPLANSQTNQIAIGYGVVGLGSNTTVIGNSSTTATKLFGSLQQTSITSTLTKVDSSGIFVAAVAGTDYQAALTGTGFVKSTAGTISYDTATYLTANQSITLSGVVTGTGTTAITTSLASSVVGITNLSATGTPSSTTYLRGDNTWATISGGGGTTTNAATFNNSGSGASSGTTFDGSVARTISYNTIGAQQALTLTTTGTSGAATLVSGTLNIPQYSGGGSATTRSLDTFTATAGQTAFTASNTLTAGYFDVYVQGVRLNSNSYSATSSVVTLNDASIAGDIVDIVNYATLSITPTLPTQTGNAGKVLSTDGSSTSWQALTTALNSVEINLGSVKRSGKFTITSSGLTPGKSVMIQQAMGPYTGKGTLADEAEMDMIIATGVVTNSTTITCHWSSHNRVKGNIKFNYIINA